MLDASLSDASGHGTEVVGIIGAHVNNNLGSCGVAPDVQIMFGKTSTYAVSEIIVHMNNMIAASVDAINCSWGAPSGGSAALLQAFTAARDAGVICPCAVFNNPTDYNSPTVRDVPTKWLRTDTNPDGLDNLIAVTSSMPDDRLLPGGAAWGNKYVHLAAPGYAIVTTGKDPAYPDVYVNGTSFATAIVSGSVALLKAHYPEESYRQIIQRIVLSVRKTDELAGKTISGGVLDVEAAMKWVWSEPTIRIECADGLINLRIGGLNDHNTQYSLLTTTNMDANCLWTEQAIITATTNTVTYQLTNTMTDPQRFFKVKIR